MSTQRLTQLLIAILIVTGIAIASERSRVLASILVVMPVNVTIGLWFVFSDTSGDPVLMADFSRMVLLGLIPAALFVVACWLGFRQGWGLWRVLAVGYGVWLAAIVVYRIIEAQMHRV